ncbi:hypothetical protein SH1V18_03930 [Vallitalea longa]|uniref:Pre-toxin TG domain-containing protein n=1 Tax=Vallitalea longa TaxID=2936439 RepID=A0A9W5YAV4_9FIRM|nr:hypothetical protein [Vallitalea longa]GKX27913.1 hypothetical protein SH1V18_03930 [Vallitalea longa]
MYVISVKSEELSRKEIQLKRIASAIESNKNRFSGISNSLDYDIKCRQNIYHELNILYKELDNIELQLYKFCDFLTETCEAYLEAEARLQSYTYRDSIEFNNYTKPPELPDEKEESFFTRIGDKLKSGIKHLVSFFANTNEKINNSYDDEELLTWDEIDNTKKNSVFDYLERSGEQIVMGNYTDEVTLLGTGGQIGLGILGLDAPMDVRDIVCDFHKWEWSWGHVGQTALDLIGLIPIVGAFKYADEVGTLAKGVSKSSDVIKNIDKADEIVDGLKASDKTIEFLKDTENIIKEIKIDTAYEAISSGAIDDILSKMSVDEFIKLEDLGESMYKGFRAMDDDFIKIANNTDFSIEDINKIKEHLFFKKHKFANGSVRRFDANYWQAEAWDRLMKGTPKASDITLLNHELFELRYMKKHNVVYEVAHEKANELYNWSEEVFGK